ncbi:MAG: branched-chain amino acid ABC transporter permease [Acidimicrobiaceae bacterium]|nr:branched-chain amino acid ABC transporter permease [Acidimicrobiaceae bacterium]
MNWPQLLVTVLTLGSIFGVVTLSLNLQYARGGMINFGIVAYFAVGAYTYAIFTQPAPQGLDQYKFGFGWPWWAAVIIAGLAALVFAAVTGWPTLRLRGEYLALTTFAFAEVFHSLLLNERRIGNGTVGLARVERPFGDWGPIEEKYVFAGAAVLLLVATLVVFRRLLVSPYGRALDAIRDDETAALAAGKPAQQMRRQVFLISAVPVGFAGAVYAMFTTLAQPSLFTAEVTFIVWIALVLGGERSVYGVVLGTVGLVFFEEIVRAWPFETVRSAQIAAAVEHVVTGLVFIAVLRFQPFQAAATRLKVSK